MTAAMPSRGPVKSLASVDARPATGVSTVMSPCTAPEARWMPDSAAGPILPRAAVPASAAATRSSWRASNRPRVRSSLALARRSRAPGRPLVWAAATSAACPCRVTASLRALKSSVVLPAAIEAKRMASEPNRVAVAAWYCSSVMRFDAAFSWPIRDGKPTNLPWAS